MRSDQSENQETCRDEQEPARDYHTLKKQYEALCKKNEELCQDRKKAIAAATAKSEFLANMSHDLRTPLHAILSYSRFGIDKMEKVDKEKLIKYFHNIEESGKKLQEMLNQIVDLSKLEAGKMVFQMYSINLSLVIESLLKENRPNLEAKQLKTKTCLPENTSPVFCDQNKITRVMKSLLKSAIKHSPQGGTISIGLEECQAAGADSQDSIRVSFRDQRIESVPSKIIEDFDAYIANELTRAGSGISGIDLAIAYKIVNYHNGRIKVDHCEQGGISCSIFLPLKQP